MPALSRSKRTMLGPRLDAARELAHAAAIIEQTLAGGTVKLGGVTARVLRRDGTGLAEEIIEALQASGFEIKRTGRH